MPTMIGRGARPVVGAVVEPPVDLRLNLEVEPAKVEPRRSLYGGPTRASELECAL